MREKGAFPFFLPKGVYIGRIKQRRRFEIYLSSILPLSSGDFFFQKKKGPFEKGLDGLFFRGAGGELTADWQERKSYLFRLPPFQRPIFCSSYRKSAQFSKVNLPQQKGEIAFAFRASTCLPAN